MKKLLKILLVFMLLLIPTFVHAEDDFEEVSKKIGKSEAIDKCMTGDEGDYRCYRYTHLPGIHPMYNTTVWSNKDVGCGFELASEWDYKNCKTASLDITYEECKGEYCRNISHSGYSGTPDFYDKRVNKEVDRTCDNIYALHIIYRVITILAPIITILFITFDLVASIISGDAKKVSKFRSKLLRRVIALLVLVALPILIHVLVNTLSKNEYIKDAVYLKCVVIGSNKDTTITDNTIPKPEKSNPNLINSITINGKPLDGFSTSTKSYSLTVSSGTENVNVQAVASNPNVMITSGTGDFSLREGTNTIKIVGTTDGIDYDVVTIKITREVPVKRNDTPKSNTNKSTNTNKPAGTSKGTTTYTFKGTKYIVIKTKYSGGLVGYQKMLKSNGIYQTSLKKKKVSGADGCCGGVSILHACGLYKGKSVTQSNVNKKACNNSNNGCSGGFATKGKCTNSESELMKYIVKYINAGRPVTLAVTGGKVTNKKTKKWIKPHYYRHFVTVVGYKGNGTSFKDLLVLDSWDAELKKVNASTTSGRRTQQSGVIIDNGSCSKNFANVIK